MDPRKRIEQAQARHPHNASGVHPGPMPAPAPAAEHLMLLPAAEPGQSRLVRVPEDFEAHEAYRAVTGIIAGIEERDADYDWDDIQSALEEHGFESVEFSVGPSLD